MTDYQNAILEIVDAIEKSATKDIKSLLKKYKQYQDDLIKAISALVVENLADDGSVLFSYNLTANLQDEIEKVLNELATTEKAFTDDLLYDAYREALEKTSDVLGIKPDWTLTREEFIKQAIESPIDGLKYSERIWNNTNRLANVIYADVVDIVKNGTRPNAITKKIKDDFGVTAYQAARLVNTELARCVSEASLEVYKNSGVVDKVMWCATLESNTCDYCADMDGRKFDIGDIPKIPAHPSCRCCYVPVVDDWKPTMRADNSTKKNIAYVTYNKWAGK